MIPLCINPHFQITQPTPTKLLIQLPIIIKTKTKQTPIPQFARDREAAE